MAEYQSQSFKSVKKLVTNLISENQSFSSWRTHNFLLVPHQKIMNLKESATFNFNQLGLETEIDPVNADSFKSFN